MDKIVFSSSRLPKSVVSIPSTSEIEGESYYAFRTSGGSTAAINILIENAKHCLEQKDGIPLISGDPDSNAASFVNDIKNEEDWIKKIFAVDELGIRSVRELFSFGLYQNIFSVFIRTDFLSGDRISILKNGELISNPAELQLLQNKYVVGECAERNSAVAKINSFPSRVSVMSDEVKHLSSGVVAPKILDIFSKKLEEQLIKNGVSAVKDKLDDLSKRELSYHLSQHTYIELLPNEWAISFEFEVINAGFLPISRRTHQYWFELPQGEVEFDIRDELGRPIKYTVTKASEKYREILLELPRVLQALDRIKYKISYRVNALMKRDNFYYLSPRTLTKKLGLTIRRYDKRKFEEARISVECEGGFIKDNPPDIKIESENGLETLHWTQSSPRPGELYRTLWTNQETEWETEDKFVALKDKVIRFPDRTS